MTYRSIKPEVREAVRQDCLMRIWWKTGEAPDGLPGVVKLVASDGGPWWFVPTEVKSDGTMSLEWSEDDSVFVGRVDLKKYARHVDRIETE